MEGLVTKLNLYNLERAVTFFWNIYYRQFVEAMGKEFIFYKDS